MFCPICGSSIANDTKFCPICGSKIVTEVESQPAPQTEAPTYQQPTYAPQPAYQAAPVPTYQATYKQPAYAPTPVVDAEYAKKRGIAISAMVFALISAFAIPWWFSPLILIFAAISKKKLKQLNKYGTDGIKPFAVIAKVVGTFGFIYGLIGTIIWGLLVSFPLLFYVIYMFLVIVVVICIAVTGGF